MKLLTSRVCVCADDAITLEVLVQDGAGEGPTRGVPAQDAGADPHTVAVPARGAGSRIPGAPVHARGADILEARHQRETLVPSQMKGLEVYR